MTDHTAFDALKASIPDAIAAMGDTFDSHQLILWLAEHNQGAYIRALAEYAGQDAPFKNLHSHLAQSLLGFSDMVCKDEEKSKDNTSQNIWGHVSHAVVWRKV